MRFLCLAGARYNAEVLRALLMPVVDDLESDGTASFHFIHGAVEVQIPPDQKEFHCPPPHFRFLDSVFQGTSDEDLSRRDVEINLSALTPEQKYHKAMNLLRPMSSGRIQSVLDQINEVMRDEGPFQGIIGDSEGAVVAATLIVDQLMQSASLNSQPPLKCAVFIGGGPPWNSDGTEMFLADEYGQLINMPTCHIIGYNDRQIAGPLALYHLCNEESASLVDHGRGHRLPHDPRSGRFMIKGIRDLIARTERGSSAT